MNLNHEAWWRANQTKNLAALSLSLTQDLGHLDLPVDCSPIALPEFAARALSLSYLKKFEHESSDVADAAALDKFLHVNEACGNWELVVESEDDTLLLGEFRNSIYRFCNIGDKPLLTSFGQILDHGDVGPGVSLGANGNDFYSKLFSSRLSTTSESLYIAYSYWISSCPTLCNADSFRASEIGEFDTVKGNRLSFVPKNVDVSRCICIEPSLNMFFQLGVKHILEERLKSFFGIDFSNQQAKNRDLAQLASMFDKQWVTIDLSSASDSMATKMLKWALPDDFSSWLNLLRSPSMLLPNGSQLELNMISTMGNGFTFPLQTMLFSCIVKAAHRVAGVPFELPRGTSLGNFAVYGDDIICRVEVYPHVLRLLKLLGFTLNSSKSFDLGPFRESCGGDFFNGHPVRPVYLRRLASTQDAYVAVNQLNRWTARTGIPVFSVCRLLLSWIRRLENLVYVPLCESDDAGLKVPRSAVRDILKDPHVQSVKYRYWKVRPVQISFERRRGDSSITTGIFGPHRSTEKLFYNPDGLLSSFLRGNIAGGSVSIRHDRKTYQLKSKVIPWWDFIGESDSIALSGCRLHLGNAICWNTGL